MRRLIIAVTAKDIADGVRRQCDRCPIARSLARRFPGESCELDFEIGRIGQQQWFRVPIDMERWMTDFDEHRVNVKPTRFCVELKGAGHAAGNLHASL
jgi:hypothetical protein